MVRVALALSTLLLGATAPVDPRTINDDWPPARFTATTATRVIFATSQDEIDKLCGPAPENMSKGGCTGHDAFGLIIVVPHPALVKDAAMFRLIVTHELAHVNGWSELHEK